MVPHPAGFLLHMRTFHACLLSLHLNLLLAHTQIQEAAAKLQQLGVGAVLVKLGADGSLLLPGEGW